MGRAPVKLPIVASAIKLRPNNSRHEEKSTSFCSHLVRRFEASRPTIIPVPRKPINSPKPDFPAFKTSCMNPGPSEKTPPAAVKVKAMPNNHGRTWV